MATENINPNLLIRMYNGLDIIIDLRFFKNPNSTSAEFFTKFFDPL